jgi:5'(3')-deoxyribonucleotidase
MSKRPIIFVDVDGVLCDFVSAYLALVKEHTGREHAHADVTAFELHTCVVSKEEDNHIWQNLIDRPGFISNMVDLPGAQEGLEELRSLGKVCALTSPHLGPFWMHERAKWLMARGFSKREIIFASEKSHVHGDVLIDDRFDNCVDWSRANFYRGGAAVVLDAPWNAGHENLHVRRAFGWRDAVDYVREDLGRRRFEVSP